MKRGGQRDGATDSLCLGLEVLCLLNLLSLRHLGRLDPLAVRLVLGVGTEQVVPPSEGRRVVLQSRPKHTNEPVGSETRTVGMRACEDKRGTHVDEGHVVEVVVLGSGPERQPEPGPPGEVVARVGLDGLEESHDDPDVDGHDVQRSLGEDGLRSNGEQQGSSDGSGSEDEDLDGVGVLGSLERRKDGRGQQGQTGQRTGDKGLGARVQRVQRRCGEACGCACTSSACAAIGGRSTGAIKER